jgi:hypothetical protein
LPRKEWSFCLTIFPTRDPTKSTHSQLHGTAAGPNRHPFSARRHEKCSVNTKGHHHRRIHSSAAAARLITQLQNDNDDDDGDDASPVPKR